MDNNHEIQNEDLIIESLKQKTGFDEDVIGCFLSNYKILHLCPVAKPIGYCREFSKCKTLYELIKNENNKEV